MAAGVSDRQAGDASSNVMVDAARLLPAKIIPAMPAQMEDRFILSVSKLKGDH
jgi:hypothetical protein